jgi:divalent metal cation (Fe/Co/Zn/Cd) transporter
VATASGNLAVAAEVVHNVVDLLAAVAVLIGLKLASRKSKVFPYGLYKVENLVAAGLAVMVFFSAYEIARNALLAPPTAVRAEGWMIALLVASAMLPLLFSHFELRAGSGTSHLLIKSGSIPLCNRCHRALEPPLEGTLLTS